MMQQPTQQVQPPKKPKSQKYLPDQQQKQFKIKHVIGRGTFGVVYSAYWNTKNMEVAIKSILKNPKFKNRQVEILSTLKHPCVVDLMMHYEKYDENAKKVYTNLVMDYVPATLLSILRSSGSKYNKLDFVRIVGYSKKILQALAYLEQKNICHRDIKPSNVLIDEGKDIVKICDFGSAKQLKKGQKSITYICSRYYRAPELILGCSEYSTKIDIWSAGCVIAQLITVMPLFDGNNNIDQMAKIIKVLGIPTKDDLINMKVDNFNGEMENVVGIGLSQKIKKANSNCPPLLINLIEQLVVYDPNKRLSAKQALDHPIFKEELKQLKQMKS